MMVFFYFGTVSDSQTAIYNNNIHNTLVILEKNKKKYVIDLFQNEMHRPNEKRKKNVFSEFINKSIHT